VPISSIWLSLVSLRIGVLATDAPSISDKHLSPVQTYTHSEMKFNGNSTALNQSILSECDRSADCIADNSALAQNAQNQCIHIPALLSSDTPINLTSNSSLQSPSDENDSLYIENAAQNILHGTTDSPNEIQAREFAYCNKRAINTAEQQVNAHTGTYDTLNNIECAIHIRNTELRTWKMPITVQTAVHNIPCCEAREGHPPHLKGM